MLITLKNDFLPLHQATTATPQEMRQIFESEQIRMFNEQVN